MWKSHDSHMICLCFREGVYMVQVEGEMVKTGEGMVAETEVVKRYKN